MAQKAVKCGGKGRAGGQFASLHRGGSICPVCKEGVLVAPIDWTFLKVGAYQLDIFQVFNSPRQPKRVAAVPRFSVR